MKNGFASLSPPILSEPARMAVDAVAELFATAGIKVAAGKIWAFLYLQNEPQSAESIAGALSMSAGAVSMGISELLEVGIVFREAGIHGRAFHYRAETEMWPLVRRIFRERAKGQLERPIAKLKQAYGLLQATAPDTDAGRSAHQLMQLRHLVDLADFALVLLDAFMERTRVEMKAAKKWLSVSGKLGGEPLSRLRRRLNHSS